MEKKILGICICTLLMAATATSVASINDQGDWNGKNPHIVSFSQIDWYYQGTAFIMNSLWGRIDLITSPDSSFWYMNIVADAGYGPAWIIQNYPIFPTSYHLPTEQAVYFNIADLGFEEGMPLEVLFAVISFEQTPLQTQPEGEIVDYYVSTSIRDAWGHTNEPPETVGVPTGHTADGEVTDAVKHTDVPSVQEWHKNCITGSYARSIKWLDNEYDLENLPEDITAQQIYDELNASGVGHGSGHHDEEEMLEKKASYLKGLDNRSVTKFVDLTGWMSDNVTNCTEAHPDNLKDWLQSELETEDVEMFYDHHCITITGIYTQNTSVFLEYRDDEKQGDDSAGDTAEKEGQLTHVGDEWFFNGARVDYVVSESINNPPEAPSIDGPTTGKARTPQEYNITTSDPDGDKLFYFIDWGDSTPNDHLGPYNSGEIVTATHTWSKRGTYLIKVKASDIYNAESDWTTLSVTMPYISVFLLHSFWERFFEHFPSAFPLLRHVLGC